VGRGREGQIGMTGATLLTVELVPIDQLRPDPANPRRISDEELDPLERSLRQFGFVQPVLARREDGTVKLMPKANVTADVAPPDAP
jgi:hypothetical protein